MAKKTVIDSSVIAKLLNKNKEEHIEQADSIIKDAHVGKVALFAPEVAKYEIGKLLVLGKKLSQSEARIALETLFGLPIEFVSHSQDLSRESHAIASEFELTYNESVFLALAEQKGACLVTDILDSKLKPPGIEIIALRDYR